MKYQIIYDNGQVSVLEAQSYEEAEKTSAEIAKQMGAEVLYILDEVDAYR